MKSLFFALVGLASVAQALMFLLTVWIRNSHGTDYSPDLLIYVGVCGTNFFVFWRAMGDEATSLFESIFFYLVLVSYTAIFVMGVAQLYATYTYSLFTDFDYWRRVVLSNVSLRLCFSVLLAYAIAFIRHKVVRPSLSEVQV